jgi:hypothetical protein
MRLFLIIVLLFIAPGMQAQSEKDSLLLQCPVYITDTVSANNFLSRPDHS